MIDVLTLLERCRQGDDLAWEALVRRYQRRVFAVAYHFMREPDEARDMAQEIFIRIYQQIGRFQGDRNFLPWMMSLARNACIDRLRKRKSRPPAQDVPIEDGTQIAATGSSPEMECASEWRRRLLYKALDRMSESNREIILMKEIQGLKLEEISKLLALPIGTVKSRSNRARIDLAGRLRVLDPSYGT